MVKTAVQAGVRSCRGSGATGDCQRPTTAGRVQPFAAGGFHRRAAWKTPEGRKRLRRGLVRC